MSQHKAFAPEDLVLSYLQAKSKLVELGFGPEIDYQDGLAFDAIAESDFLREAAWVVLSSGMREAVIRSKFRMISEAFYDWESSRKIIVNKRTCLLKALKAFNNKKKMEAICQICMIVNDSGIDCIKSNIKKKGIDFISSLPYMGSVTSYHLAKNLGIVVVKPDRHLSRISEMAGYIHPIDMCKEIEKHVGDKLSVIDIVIWRYATLFNYESLFVRA